MAITKTGEDIIYHGSGKRLKILKPRDLHGDPDIKQAIFGSPSKAMALAYAGGRWGDTIINQGGTETEDHIVEMSPGVLKATFDRPGYLYENDASLFSNYPGRDPLYEVVATQNVKPLRTNKIPNVLKALENEGVKVHEYDRESDAYKQAVKRMAERSLALGKEYLGWVKRENPGLYTDIKKEIG